MTWPNPNATILAARLGMLRKQAAFFSKPRRKDADLYRLLADMLAFCEEVELDGTIDDLRAAIRVSVDARGQGNAGRGRRYTESGSDVFTLVARYALESETDSRSFYRYGMTLREASKRQIRSGQLVEWFMSNGGVNALFKTRPVKARTARTKLLNLTKQIEVPKGVPFTLTLIRTDTGFFDVLSEPAIIPLKPATPPE